MPRRTIPTTVPAILLVVSKSLRVFLSGSIVISSPSSTKYAVLPSSHLSVFASLKLAFVVDILSRKDSVSLTLAAFEFGLNLKDRLVS